MAYPASTKTLEEMSEKVDFHANTTKDHALSLRTQSTTDHELIREKLYELMGKLNEAINYWNFAKTSGGIDLRDYVRAQKKDDLLDVVGEFNSMIAAATTLRDWVVANMPTGPNGEEQVRIRNIDNSVTQLKFTEAELTTMGFYTAVDAFTPTIS